MAPVTASDTIKLRSRLSAEQLVELGSLAEAVRLGDHRGRGATDAGPVPSSGVIRLASDLTVTVARPGPLSRFAVRTFDLVSAGLAVLALAPVMALVALAVRLDSRGPLLYGSPRHGQGGTRFKAWKFRSMSPTAEADLADLLARDPQARREYETYHKLQHDPRLTRVGRFIRKSSLDELPQLFNILSGQMSVVGPRPKIDADAEAYGPALDAVLTVKPGLTGLWQVSGRHRVPMSERIALDLAYIENRTLRGDIWICLRTFGQLWRPGKHGAY